MPQWRSSAREIDDRELARFLAWKGLMEMRVLASRAKRAPEEVPSAEALEQLRDTADFCQDMLSVSMSRTRRPPRGHEPSRRDRAMAARPLSYRWATCGPERRAWVLRQVERFGFQWTPPPPLPVPRKGPPQLGIRHHLGLLRGWPVKTPAGRRPLPRHARVLKAVDGETVDSLYEEAGRRRLGLGKGGPWLGFHLQPGAAHYLVPDPAEYYWPDPDGGRRWWECRVLLRMIDGEQVRGMLAVVPTTFAALPSTVSRRRQHLLVRTARLTERDTYLWERDHNADCGPDTCGYRPAERAPG